MKPCPFCGDTNVRAIEGDGKWYVACCNPECFCALGEGYDPSAMPDHHFLSQEDALAAWDRRPRAKRDSAKCTCKTAKGKLWQCPEHGNVSQ